MNIQKILKHISLILDLKNEGYYVGEVFLNNYNRISQIVIGCIYSDKNIQDRQEVSQQFLFLVEIFESEKGIKKYSTEKVNERTIFYGHKPNFQLAKNFIEEKNCTSLSWKNNKRIFTIINLTRSEQETKTFENLPGLFSHEDSIGDQVLKKFFKLITEKNRDSHKDHIFNYLDYLPLNIKNWKLVTVFLFYQVFGWNKSSFLIPNIRGNYKNDDKYLNIGIKFFYSFLPRFIDRSMIPSTNQTINVEGNGVFLVQNKEYTTLTHYNSYKRYLITVSNNETSKDLRGHEDTIRLFISKILNKMESYSCIEETMRLMNFTKTV